MKACRWMLLGALLAMAGCASQSSSELVSVAKDPDMAGASYGRYFVLALAAEPERRRLVEDAVVQRLTQSGVDAVASYESLPKLDLENEAALRQAAEEAVKSAGADAALVGKIVSENRRTEYTAPRVEQSPVPAAPYFMGYGAYVGYGYQTVITPGAVQEIHEYFLQTSVYDVASAKPVWRAQSRTLNPENLDQAVSDVADMLVRRLAQDGMLKAAAAPRASGGY